MYQIAELQNFNFLSSSRWETRFCDPETPNKCLALTLCTQNGVGTNISGRERKFSPRGEKRSRGLNRRWPGSSCICLEVAILQESKGGEGAETLWHGAGQGMEGSRHGLWEGTAEHFLMRQMCSLLCLPHHSPQPLMGLQCPQ